MKEKVSQNTNKTIKKKGWGEKKNVKIGEREREEKKSTLNV